jgi:hypothetical protein
MEQASCITRPDLDWFDLDCSMMQCLELCAACPVGDQCLQAAIDNEYYDGIWGGEWGYRLARYIREGRGRQHGR